VIIFKKRVPGLTTAAMTGFVARARRAARLQQEVNILVTSSRELQSLNRRFRGKNYPTDVLSFPAGGDLEKSFAGDVAISAEIATKSALQLRHSTAEEVKILVLHGLLHLAGYDHERDHGEMARKENRLRRSLGLPVGLIERQSRHKTRTTLATGSTPKRKLTGKGARAARTSK